MDREDVGVELFSQIARVGTDSHCLSRNARLVYGRVTGWGQSAPLATSAGHDLNYIAVTGVLDAIGRAKRPPTIPLNLIGALLHRERTGEGQSVEVPMLPRIPTAVWSEGLDSRLRGNDDGWVAVSKRRVVTLVS